MEGTTRGTGKEGAGTHGDRGFYKDNGSPGSLVKCVSLENNMTRFAFPYCIYVFTYYSAGHPTPGFIHARQALSDSTISPIPRSAFKKEALAFVRMH